MTAPKNPAKKPALYFRGAKLVKATGPGMKGATYGRSPYLTRRSTDMEPNRTADPITTLAAIVARTLGHDKAVTPGPWEYVNIDDGESHATGRSPRVVDVDDCHVCNVTGAEARFIAAARTDAPAMARALAALLPLVPLLERRLALTQRADALKPGELSHKECGDLIADALVNNRRLDDTARAALATLEKP